MLVFRLQKKNQMAELRSAGKNVREHLGTPDPRRSTFALLQTRVINYFLINIMCTPKLINVKNYTSSTIPFNELLCSS